MQPEKKHTDSSRVLPPFKKVGQLKQPSNSSYEPCFGLAAEGKRPNGIRLFFSNGEVALIYYHDLMSPLRFNGSDTITLRTPFLVITIKGKNLDRIMDGLLEQNLVWIKELSGSMSQIPDNEPDITGIVLTESG